MELVVARIDELRLRMTEHFEAALRQGYGEPDSNPVGSRNRFSVALSGGSTALIFLGALRNANVDWSRVQLFWADERAVPPDDVESNYGVADRLLLGPLGAKAPRAFRMPADMPHLGAAALRYDSILAHELRGGPLDLAILGVGEDGHVCSLFPGHRALVDDDLRVVAVEDAPKPPPQRLSLTMTYLRQTKKIWVIAIGPRKLPVLKAAMDRNQRLTPLDLLLQQAKDVTIYTDQVIHRA